MEPITIIKNERRTWALVRRMNKVILSLVIMMVSISLPIEAQWKRRLSVLDGTGSTQIKREMTAADTLSTIDQENINANADKVAPYYLLVTNPYCTKYDTAMTDPPYTLLPTDKNRGGFVIDCITPRGIGQFFNFLSDSSIALLIDIEGIEAYGLKVDATANDSSYSARNRAFVG